MNRILEIDTENQIGTAEAGVRLSDFSMAVEYAGLYFPPHPGDDSAMLGGLVATNAGGCRAVKYGTVRNYVRGLEVVLPTGEIIKLGGKFVKSSTGYNLMHLMIGSEGTLGIVTRTMFQLHAKPPLSRSFVVPYAGLEPALATMSALMKKGVVPVAIEFLEVEPIAMAEERLKLRWPSRLGKTHLFIMIDAYAEEELDGLSQMIGDHVH
jgi:FAD/FMN-containing dehydrogenases